MRAVSCRRLGESRRSCTEAPLAGELLPYKGGMSMSWQIEKALDELVSQETGAVVYPFGRGGLWPFAIPIRMTWL